MSVYANTLPGQLSTSYTQYSCVSIPTQAYADATLIFNLLNCTFMILDKIAQNLTKNVNATLFVLF